MPEFPAESSGSRSPPSSPQEDPTSRQNCRCFPKSEESEPTSCNEPAPIFTSPRPYSTPDATLESYHNQPDSSTRTRPERHSSASLSTLSQIPFYALPRVSSNAAFSGPAIDSDSNTHLGALPFSAMDSIPLSSSGPSTSTDHPVPCFAEHTSSTNSSSSTSESDDSSISASSYPTSQGSASDPPDKHSPTAPLSSYPLVPFPSTSSQPRISDASSSLQSQISPFRAPLPPSYQPSSRVPLSQPTAMRRYMIPPHDTTPYPPPDPPVILPIENTTMMNQSSLLSQAPYFPFLSHAPPPENTWIEIETVQNEYRLHVHLPGFTREGITLATKRRRILHVVADKWENGGGHFERRVSFGYDADLVQVRADFDGLMLRIMIPRRISPVILHTMTRSPPLW